jgi:hypothetical protein
MCAHAVPLETGSGRRKAADKAKTVAKPLGGDLANAKPQK